MKITVCDDCRKALTPNEASYYFLDRYSMAARGICRDCNLERLDRLKVAKELRKLQR